MRELSNEEKAQWAAIAKTVTPIDCPALNSRMARIRAAFIPTPSWVLDLHNTTLEDAYRAVLDLLDEAIAYEAPAITVITGKSGQICREFPHWAQRFPIRDIEVLNGGGAFRLTMRKKTI